MIKVGADMTPMEGFVGAVGGMLSAIASAKSKDLMVGRYMDKTKAAFMTDSIAVNEAGSQNIRHVFEWGDKQGTTSSIPLFRLIKASSGDVRYLSYEFLPSTQVVPLPDPSKTGISPEVIAKLTPHIFRLKAMVMETMENVTISPAEGKALFIPAADQPKGYVMSSKPVTVNPGGNSTGGFEKWWMEWFDTRATEIVKTETTRAGEFISKTGQTIIRDATTGRFSAGTAVSFGYVQAAKRNAELQMQAALESEFTNE